jgi:hypothetical protein
MNLIQIFHKKRKPHQVQIGGAGPTWERKSLPGAGAQQYAYETYGTPLYDFALGNGATFIRRPLLETQPASWANFATPIVANPPQNIFQGQFATQPLMDPNTAVGLGLTVDGAIPPDSYNLMPSFAPTLAP